MPKDVENESHSSQMEEKFGTTPAGMRYCPIKTHKVLYQSFKFAYTITVGFPQSRVSINPIMNNLVSPSRTHHDVGTTIISVL